MFLPGRFFSGFYHGFFRPWKKPMNTEEGQDHETCTNLNPPPLRKMPNFPLLDDDERILCMGHCQFIVSQQ